MTQKRYKALLLIALLVASTSVGAAIGWQERAEAITLPQVLAGGRSAITQWCNGIGFVITVTPPRPGEFLIHPPPTVIYAYGQFMGSWVVGGAMPGGICCTGKICRPVMATMLLVGTSPI